MKALKFVAVALFLVALSGCATTMGHDYDQSKVASFVPHQTTVDQVIAALGQPQERETESDGTTRLHYQLVVSKSSIGSYIPGVSLIDHSSSTAGSKDSFLYFDRTGKYLRAENNQSNM